MADITTDMIKELRAKTQAGMMDCKKALQENDGDMEKAVDYLRKKGIAKASKKMDREASEGAITSYIHSNNKIGVLLELRCNTDFVAKNDDFVALGRDLAMHIAASNPLYVAIEDVPQEDIEREKDIYRDQMKDSGKPDNVIEKIIEGKLGKFYSEVCLMEQEFVKEPGLVIKDMLKEKITTYGENIEVGRFVRYQLG